MCIPKIESRLIDLRTSGLGEHRFEPPRNWIAPRVYVNLQRENSENTITPVPGLPLRWEWAEQDQNRTIPMIKIYAGSKLFVIDLSADDTVTGLLMGEPTHRVRYILDINLDTDGHFNRQTRRGIIYGKKFEQRDTIVFLGDREIRLWGKLKKKAKNRAIEGFISGLKELEESLRISHERGCRGRVVLMGIQPLGSRFAHLKDLSEILNKQYLEMAQRNPEFVGFVSLEKVFPGEMDSYLMRDGIHLNTSGIHLIFHLMSAMVNALAGLRERNGNLTEVPIFAQSILN